MKNQREDAPGIADAPFEVPVPEDECVVGAKGADLQLRKLEFSHMSLVWIAFAISLEQAAVAAYDAVAARESELWRIPVALEKGRNIAAIPSCLLIGQHCPNFARRVAGGSLCC
jgi:hypothetical protein